MNKAILAASLLGALCSGALAPAMAGEPAADAGKVAVYYGDLNLQSDTGQRTLKARVTRAARSVCPDASSRDLDTKTEGKACVRRAVGNAMNDVSERQLANAATVAGDRS